MRRELLRRALGDCPRADHLRLRLGIASSRPRLLRVAVDGTLGTLRVAVDGTLNGTLGRNPRGRGSVDVVPSVLHGVAQRGQPSEHALHDLAERVPGEVAEERRFLAALVPDPVARLDDVAHVVVGQQRAGRAPHGLEQHVQDLGQDHVVVVGIGRLEPAQRDGVGDAVHGLRGVGVVLADEPVLQNLVHGGQRHPER